MSLLQRLLEKRGIKKVDDLSVEEKAQFENWKRVLSEPETMTVDAIKAFCDRQVTLIEAQFRDPSKSDREKSNLTLVHSVYSSIRQAIVSPKLERETLEKYLNQLINSGAEGA